MAADANQLKAGVLVLVEHPWTGKPFTAKVEAVYDDMISLLPDWWSYKYPQVFWLANVVAVLDTSEHAGACLRLRHNDLAPVSDRRTA